jgi:DNA-binding XRE family transcriptional regulator
MKNLMLKKKKFVKLYKTGLYTQKQISEQISVSEQSICRWVKDLPEISLCNTQKTLIKELERITKQNCKNNKAEISSLIADIERLKKLIK